MPPFSLEITAALVAQVVGVLSGLAFLYHKVIKPLWHDLRWLKSAIQFINAELRPNGGSSLRDAVNRIDKSVTLLDQRQQATLNFDSDSFFETYADGRVRWASRAYCAFCGCMLGELLGHGWRTFILESEREEATREWDAAIKDNRDYVGTHHFKTPDGHKKARVFASVLRDGHGNLLGWFGYVRCVE